MRGGLLGWGPVSTDVREPPHGYLLEIVRNSILIATAVEKDGVLLLNSNEREGIFQLATVVKEDRHVGQWRRVPDGLLRPGVALHERLDRHCMPTLRPASVNSRCR